MFHSTPLALLVSDQRPFIDEASSIIVLTTAAQRRVVVDKRVLGMGFTEPG